LHPLHEPCLAMKTWAGLQLNLGSRLAGWPSRLAARNEEIALTRGGGIGLPGTSSVGCGEGSRADGDVRTLS
jgi:hypothetical protein